MRRRRRKAFAACLLAAIAGWPMAASPQDATPRKFSGEYSFYSGTPGERAMATKRDTKVAIYVDGPLAARMFRSMGGGAATNSCSEGEETRVRDELMCTRDKSTGKAECYFGFDLHTGKSTLGTAC